MTIRNNQSKMNHRMEKGRNAKTEQSYLNGLPKEIRNLILHNAPLDYGVVGLYKFYRENGKIKTLRAVYKIFLQETLATYGETHPNVITYRDKIASLMGGN